MMTLEEIQSQLVASVENSKRLQTEKLYREFLPACDSNVSKRTLLGLDKPKARKQNSGLLFADKGLF